MSTILAIILIIIALNIAGGYAYPTYRQGSYYAPSWGAIILVLVILYFTGHLST